MAVSFKLDATRELLDAATRAPSLPKVCEEESESYPSSEIGRTHLEVRLGMISLNLQTPTDMSYAMCGVLDVLRPWSSLDDGKNCREKDSCKERVEDFAEGNRNCHCQNGC